MPSAVIQLGQVVLRVRDGIEQCRHQSNLLHTVARLRDPKPQLAHPHLFGHQRVGRFVHPFWPLWLLPPHDMVTDAKTATAAEVKLASLMHPEDAVDLSLKQLRYAEI